MNRSRLASLASALVVLAVAVAPLGAQDAFPSKPITVWVGFPAGGGTDILTRALAESAEKQLGQKIVVVNKPGASGTVATTELTRAKADGYTLVSNTDTPVTRSPHLRDLDYDPFRDLTPIMMYGRYKVTWAVREDSPFKTWKDVVDWAKKNPGQLTFGHPGPASTPNLVMIKIAAKEGFTFRSVPFAGDAPSVTALLGGHVTMVGGSSSSFAGYVQAKRMRILLVNEKEGIDYAPQALTIEKAGYGIESATVLIVTAPKDLPRPIAAKLERAFIEATKMEPFVSVAKKSETIVPEPITGAALGDFLKKLSASYEQLIKEAGLYKSEKK
jgi:tripartite-type tricarboxylate transporter receptor subunit TctC